MAGWSMTIRVGIRIEFTELSHSDDYAGSYWEFARGACRQAGRRPHTCRAPPDPDRSQRCRHHQDNGWVANAPRPIESETDLPPLEDQIWELLAVDQRTPAQEAYLTLLSALVERWESERVVVPAVHGVELVTALLVERQQRQKDLVTVFGTESIVSEVLSGKRGLQAKDIEGLADFFHVSPAIFFAQLAPLRA
jgi:HTH-type transcriptional regulator / antitoxin HigA